MKKFVDKIANNRVLIIVTITLQLIIIILILNPFSLLAQSTLNGVINQVVTLSNDPDFRNASIIQVSDADSFKKSYLLSDKYSAIANGDYVLLVNDKLIVFQKDQNKIVYQGAAPSSMLDSIRLANLIEQEAKNANIIKTEEVPAIRIYDADTDKDLYSDYFNTLQNGDVLAFFAENKVVVIYNLQTDKIEANKKFNLS